MGRNAPNFIIIYMYTLENSLGVKSVFSFYLLMRHKKGKKGSDHNQRVCNQNNIFFIKKI